MFRKELEYTLLLIAAPHTYIVPDDGNNHHPSDCWESGFLNKTVPNYIKCAITDIALHYKSGFTDDFLIRDSWIKLGNWINETHGRKEIRMIKDERRAKSTLTPASQRLSAEAAKYKKGSIKVALPYLKHSLVGNFNRAPRCFYYLHIPSFFKQIRDKVHSMTHEPQSSDPILDSTYDIVTSCILRHGIFSMELVSDIAENLVEAGTVGRPSVNNSIDL